VWCCFLGASRPWMCLFVCGVLHLPFYFYFWGAEKVRYVSVCFEIVARFRVYMWMSYACLSSKCDVFSDCLNVSSSSSSCNVHALCYSVNGPPVHCTVLISRTAPVATCYLYAFSVLNMLRSSCLSNITQGG
jgi:hypothetical protein